MARKNLRQLSLITALLIAGLPNLALADGGALPSTNSGPSAVPTTIAPLVAPNPVAIPVPSPPAPVRSITGVLTGASSGAANSYQFQAPSGERVIVSLTQTNMEPRCLFGIGDGQRDKGGELSVSAFMGGSRPDMSHTVGKCQHEMIFEVMSSPLTLKVENYADGLTANYILTVDKGAFTQ
jgi:hypothetical protein